MQAHSAILTKWAHILRRDADIRKEEISAASIGEFHVNPLFLLQQKSSYVHEGFPFKPELLEFFHFPSAHVEEGETFLYIITLHRERRLIFGNQM